MQHEYVEDLAKELKVNGEGLLGIIGRLGIKTEQMPLPPYGVEVSAVVRMRTACAAISLHGPPQRRVRRLQQSRQWQGK